MTAPVPALRRYESSQALLPANCPILDACIDAPFVWNEEEAE